MITRRGFFALLAAPVVAPMVATFLPIQVDQYPTFEMLQPGDLFTIAGDPQLYQVKAITTGGGMLR